MIIKDKKSKRSHTAAGIRVFLTTFAWSGFFLLLLLGQGFSYYFCLVKDGSGSGSGSTQIIFSTASTIFLLVKILKFFAADPGWGQFGSGMEKVGTLNYLYRSGNKYFLPHAKKIHEFCGFSLFSYLCVIFFGILKTI
jgi:hypothetical protein